LIYKNLTY